MIKVENLTKRYGSHTAVDDLSFTVEKGKVYGLLGVNGAGKSTTMNIITGYLSSTKGKVYVDGEDIMKKPEKAKEHIGYLPEIPALYPDMTVREYLVFAAQLRHKKGKEAAAEAERVMALASVEDVADRLIKNLSKGYKQRVGLACALTGDPDIVILDEPTVGLDPRQIIEIRSLISSLRKDHAVILSSHILSEVQAVCDEILIISKGKLVAGGSPEELEGMSKKSHELKLTVKGDEKKLQGALKSLGIEDEQIKDLKSDKEAKTASACVSMDEDKDIREDLFYALCDARLPLMELSVSHMSLEDVFIELTETEPEEISDTEAKDKDSESVADEVISAEEGVDEDKETTAEDGADNDEEVSD